MCIDLNKFVIEDSIFDNQPCAGKGGSKREKMSEFVSNMPSARTRALVTVEEVEEDGHEEAMNFEIGYEDAEL